MSSIHSIKDIKTTITEHGSEWAVVPVCNPEFSGPLPHAWIPVVNGHATGVMYSTREEAEAKGVELAESAATNARRRAATPASEDGRAR